MGDEEDEDEYEGGEYEDGERFWPKPAWHKEDRFGYLYDAGDDLIRVCPDGGDFPVRHAFKEDPSPAVPEYGDARVRGGY